MTKNMSPIEFIKYISTVTNYYISSKSFYKSLQASNLYVNMWPDCEAKKIITKFNRMVKEKSHDYAAFMIQEDADDVMKIKEDAADSVDLDPKNIQFILEKNAKLFFIKKIGNDLFTNPDNFDEIFQKLKQVTEFTNEPDEYFVSQFIDATISANEKEVKEGTAQIILPDFKIFSDQIGGFNHSRVSGLSAISGFGKTKLAINLADSARKIMPVFYFNMEMSAEDFEAQFLQKAAGLSYKDYKRGNYKKADFDKIIEYKASFENTHDICFTGGKSLSIDDVCTKISVKLASGGLAIIDYDQKLVFQDSREEWQAMVRAMERLEDVAKKTKTHIIVLFQADDEGFAKSSKRAIQPLSSFTQFTQEDAGYVLKNIKNRFGQTGFKILVDYYPEYSLVREQKLLDNVLPLKNGYRSLR